MTSVFHEGNRSLQDRYDTRALADRIDGLLVHDTISASDRAFIQGRDMFFLATTDAEGRPTCSYKGGEPGFVRVLDEHTLAFPNCDGNGMYLSMGNVLVNPNVGLLFLDLERGHRMRLEGEASIDLEDPLMAAYHEAQFIVRVRARVVYPNCPRYIPAMQLTERYPGMSVVVLEKEPLAQSLAEKLEHTDEEVTSLKMRLAAANNA